MTSADRILRTEVPLVVGDGQSVPNAPVNTGKTEQSVFRNGKWVEFWSTAHSGSHPPVADFTWSQSAPSASASTVDTGVTGISGPTTTATTVTSYTVSFNGLASFEVGGQIVAWAWTFGDGSTGSGPSPSHVYTVARTYSVTLNVTDARGVTASVTKPVTISSTVVSQPTARFTPTMNGYTLSVDGTASSSTNGATIARWDWNFGDGSAGTGPTATHTYAGGTYTVTLKVTDSNGYTGTASLKVTTNNTAPTPAFTASTNDLTVSVDASASKDPDGTIASYAWDFGDGQQGTGKTATHTYAKSGTYSVRLTVTDNLNTESSLTKSVTVTAVNANPIADFSTSTNGLALTVDGSASSDPNGEVVAWAWTFADGGTGSGVTATHTYASAGTRTVTLVVTDNQGATGTTSHQVTVTAVNTPPVPSFTVTANGLAITVDGSGSTDPGGSISAYAWAFGDGSTGTGVTATHTYANPNTYTVKLTVTDNQGVSASTTKAVTVSKTSTDYIIGAATASSTLVPGSNGAVLQQLVRSPDTGQFYTSQVHPESNGDESVRLSRMNADGSFIDQMMLTAAGHGTTFALEYSGGKNYVWLNWSGSTNIMRGVNVAGGEFSTTPAQLADPIAEYGHSWQYDSQETFDYLASRGMTVVRLPFAWEHVQRSLGAPLDSTLLGYLTGAVNRAGKAGLQVILDCHNYGSYQTASSGYAEQKIGQGVVTDAHFIDLWDRLSMAFKDNSAVLGYGLMNEPANCYSTSLTAAQRWAAWRTVTQNVLNAIRANGDKNRVYIMKMTISGQSRDWVVMNPTQWITDSANNFGFEMHIYSDDDRSGTYANTYAEELANAKAQGFTTVQARTIDYIKSFMDWCKSNKVRPYCGEYGVPTNDADAANWSTVADAVLDNFDSYGADYTWWGVGEKFHAYKLAPYVQDSSNTGPINTARQPTAGMLEGHFPGRKNDLVRFPYAAGTFARSQVAGLTVKSAGPTYRLVAFDYRGGYGVMTVGGSGTYTRHSIANMLAGNFSSPINTIRLAEGPPTMQGFATYYDSLFRYTGVASDNATRSSDKPTLTEYSWVTGQVVRTIDTSSFGGTASKTEPEGLSIYNTGNNPTLFFGVTQGPTGGPHTYPTWWYPLYNPDVVKPPPPPGNDAKSPWKLGNETEGLPSSVRVVKWSDLATSSSDNNNPQVALNRLTADSVVDISGESLTIPTFIDSNHLSGLGHKFFLGFIGGISNSTFDNLVQLKPNAMTQAQANTIAAQTTGTSTYAVIRSANVIGATSTKPVYMMGVHFVGADQPTITEKGAGLTGNQYTTAPSRYKGLDLGLAPSGSIFQNCLLQAFNSSDGNGPPWEVGHVDSRHSNNFIVRRVELDGTIPVGSPSRPTSGTADPFGRSWIRSGGFQWNADKSPKMYNFSLHNGLVSGLAVSVAGTSNNGSSNTSDFYAKDIYIESNSQKGFPGVQFEDVLSSITLDHPTFKMNSTGGYHINFNPSLQSVNAPNIPSSKFQVIEPTWSGLGFNGMFAIRIRNWGTVQTSAPTVIKNGVTLTATTSSTADPTRFYHIQAA